jgi:hypothetical protein
VAAVIRLARQRAWVPVVPAAVSWMMLFGYQWAFYITYRGHQATVFSYYSGVVGDGLLIPVVNVAGFALLRQLPVSIPWRRWPAYALLGLITATLVYYVQASRDLVNWSMPAPYQWSDVGQFHFFVLATEMTYLYIVLATALNNWRELFADSIARRSFAVGWVGVALFFVFLAVDYIH